jgi:hypothetical protein
LRSATERNMVRWRKAWSWYSLKRCLGAGLEPSRPATRHGDDARPHGRRRC